MSLLPNISFSEEELRSILRKHKIYRGGEATICESARSDTLYKIFNDSGTPLPMGDNKTNKIKELYQRQLDYSVRPVSTISFKDAIVGYEMTTDYHLETYKLHQLNREELLYFLKKTKEILEYFASEGVIYADVAPRNILFNKNNGDIQFCDMDNVQVGDSPVDLFPFQLIGYDAFSLVDDKVHPFMHNHMTLGAVSFDYLCGILSPVNRNFKRPARKILKAMNYSKEFNEGYLIDYLKKGRPHF